MPLMKKLLFVFDVIILKPEVFCKVIKYSHSCILVAELEKSRRTKDIAIKYNHFRDFEQKKIIMVCYIDTREQTSDFYQAT